MEDRNPSPHTHPQLLPYWPSLAMHARGRENLAADEADFTPDPHPPHALPIIPLAMQDDKEKQVMAKLGSGATASAKTSVRTATGADAPATAAATAPPAAAAPAAAAVAAVAAAAAAAAAADTATTGGKDPQAPKVQPPAAASAAPSPAATSTAPPTPAGVVDMVQKNKDKLFFTHPEKVGSGVRLPGAAGFKGILGMGDV